MGMILSPVAAVEGCLWFVLHTDAAGSARQKSNGRSGGVIGVSPGLKRPNAKAKLPGTPLDQPEI